MQEFVLTCVIASLLIMVSCLNIYELLRTIWQWLPKLQVHPRMRVLVAVGAVFVGHIVNIWFFAFVYYVMVHHLQLGAFSENIAQVHPFIPDFLSCLYFSSITYTTVGYGDLTPQGGLRMIASAEALTGFIMIGWTVSFTYLAMEKFWLQHIIKSKK